ncbi:MAG: heat-inducible transcriptional repressor HrcA [Alphaproteobacteria bacterium]
MTRKMGTVQRTQPPGTVGELNARSREIFRRLVDTFVETGAPVGSRTLARRLEEDLSPATIRNVMADLEEAGLLYAPHTSAGRLPTEAGLRMFVNGLLETGRLTPDERANIDGMCVSTGRSVAETLEEATAALSGLSGYAGMVLAPKTEAPLKHIEFVSLGPGRALVVLVTETGIVENRVIELPMGTPPSVLMRASNYLAARLLGRTLDEARTDIQTELDEHRAELDGLTARVVEAGLATWAGGEQQGSLIIRGQAHLLEDITAVEDLERIRGLFEALETKEIMARLLERSNRAEGVEIFIGSETHLFGLSGCSLVVAPFGKREIGQVVGAIGVIGPTHLNYARIIPMVDYTAKVVGRLLT